MTIFLYEIDYYNTDNATVETLRLASEEYRTKPTDTPANTIYDNRVTQGGIIERHMFSRAATFGRSEVGFGEFSISNADNSLDSLRRYGFDLRDFRIKSVADARTALASAETIATFTIERADFSSWTEITFVIRDALADLDVPLQPNTFAGNNGDSDDTEGTANDLKGKTKPVVIGKVRGISPPLVNQSSLIYCCNFDDSGNPKAVASIDAVKTNYNAVVLDTAIGTSGDFATIALLAAATIGSGKYATCKAKGAFRLNNLSSGETVTCDVTQGTSQTVAACIETAIVDYTSKTSSDFVTGALAALDVKQGSAFGIYVDNETTILDVVMQLAEGAGVWIAPNFERKFNVDRLEAPSGTADLTFEEWQVEAQSDGGIQILGTNDKGNGIPIWKVKYNAQKLWHVFRDQEFAGAVALADREYAKNEFRAVTAEDSSIKTAYLSSQILEITSLMDSLSDAATEAARQLTMRKALRDFLVLPVEFDGDLLGIGDVIQLNTDRFDYAGSKKFVIMGYRYDLVKKRITYTVWG